MATRTHRLCVLLAGMGLLGAALPAWAQGQGPGRPMPARQPSREVPSFSQGLLLPVDLDFPRKFEAVQDYVRDEDWERAARVLQALLDAEEDAFVPMKRTGPDGKEVVAWTTVRSEAERFLGTLPPEGLETYQLFCGARARLLLTEAKATNDVTAMAAVARRYLHTDAGGEAAALLATHHLNRGRFVLAAVCFERLLRRADAGRLSPLLLVKAVLAFERGGDKANAEMIWKRLTARNPNGLRLGDQEVTLKELQQQLARAAACPAEAACGADWLLVGGNAARSARMTLGLPQTEAAWQRPTAREEATRGWLQNAARQQEGRSQPLLPAAFPLAVGDRVVCRSHRGVCALDLNTGKVAWESGSDWSPDNVYFESQHFPHLETWVNAYLSGNPQVLVENSTLGSLSSDGSLVYAVDDLPVPPFPTNYAGFVARGNNGLVLNPPAPEMTNALYHNRLRAIHLKTGKAEWELGGRSEVLAPGEEGSPPRPLEDTFFLGPPLPLAGKLYVVTEKDQDLRLYCLDAASGDIVWTQLLAHNKGRMVFDGGRRMQAAHVACGEGVLVCPTNAGGVFGVDLLGHSLLWAYAYTEEPPPPEIDPFPQGGRFRRPRPNLPQAPPNLTTQWKVTAPVIADGKVVFTAPDEGSVHCLNLRDGAPLWKASRGPSDAYLAGVADGLVVLVGARTCRALNLADGKQVWNVETGVPSGQGAFGDGVYFLPLKAGALSKQPEVCILNLEDGTVRKRVAAPGKEALGNLLFHEGRLLSQGVDAVTAYPLEEK